MDDAEYLFHQTSKSAKRLARGAYAKKNGCRSKKCSLPSDKLTKKQLKERNGKVMSYNLSKPMDWKTFKSLDKDTKTEYLYRLVHVHHARAKDVAEMFGIHHNYFSQWLTNNDMKGIFPASAARSMHSAFFEFLHPTADDPAYVPEPVEEEKDEQEPPTRVKLDTPKASVDRGCVVYTGLPAAVFEKAYQLLDGEDEYKVTIMFVKKKGDD